MKNVYLDHAATSPIDPRVLEAMMPFLTDTQANASSPHAPGRKARYAVEEARETIADRLGAEPAEVIFTSGGTEANNLAIKTLVENASRPSLVTLETEHESVLEPAEAAQTVEFNVEFLKPGSDGKLAAGTLRLFTEAGAVSLMHTNNETGVVAPVEETAERLGETLLHTDAVQAVGWAELDFQRMGVDLLSFTGHKIYGPKGIGALLARTDRLNVSPLIKGGSQERRRRGGTENVAAIVGLARALDLAVEERDERLQHLLMLRNRFKNEIVSRLGKQVLINSPEDGAPHILSVSIVLRNRPIDGEMLLLNMDIEGVHVSRGSACTAGTVGPSHVLLAMGRDRAAADATLRFSWGKDSTAREIDFAAEKLALVVKRMTGTAGRTTSSQDSSVAVDG